MVRGRRPAQQLSGGASVQCPSQPNASQSQATETAAPAWASGAGRLSSKRAVTAACDLARGTTGCSAQQGACSSPSVGRSKGVQLLRPSRHASRLSTVAQADNFELGAAEQRLAGVEMTHCGEIRGPGLRPDQPWFAPWRIQIP